MCGKIIKMKKNKEKTENKRTKKSLSKAAIILIVGIVVIAIPCLIFAGILISSALESNSPVIGSRFDNDLSTKITTSDVENVKSVVSNVTGVENVEIDGIETGQFIVMVDVIDSYDEEQSSKIAEEVYKKVIEKLPVSTYFTTTDTNKNYDLSIHVYNRTSANDDYDSWSYVIITKNAKMDLPTTQIVSTPLDDHLAKELRGELEEAELQEDETAGTIEESGD